MRLLIVQASVVLAGHDYAPAVFTPDFLRSIKIAKKGWELGDTPVLTPITALLKYDNGLVFIVDPEHIQIIDGKPTQKISESQIGNIATTLVKHVTYARHIAVGININAFIEHGNAVDFLRHKFIKEGPWVTQDLTNLNI